MKPLSSKNEASWSTYIECFICKDLQYLSSINRPYLVKSIGIR